MPLGNYIWRPRSGSRKAPLIIPTPNNKHITASGTILTPFGCFHNFTFHFEPPVIRLIFVDLLITVGIVEVRCKIQNQ